MDKITVLYHAGYPNHAKIRGLDVLPVPLCEGGGYMLPKDLCEGLREMQERLIWAEKIMGTLHANLEQSSEYGETLILQETGEELESYFDGYIVIPTL